MSKQMSPSYEVAEKVPSGIHPGARQDLQPLDGAVATLELRGLGSSKPRGGPVLP